MIYLVLIVLLLLLSYFYDYKHYHHFKTEWFIFMVLYLIFIGGLRFNVGGDTIRYIENFPELPDLWGFSTYNFDNSRFSRGYILLNSFSKVFSEDFILFQFIHSSIVNIIFVWFILKYTKHIFLGIFLYFIILYFFFIFEVLREALAVSCFLIGWKYFINHKWLKYYICCLIALSFHTSAIITFFIPLFYLPIFRSFFQLNFNFFIGTIAIALIGFFLSIYFFEYLRLLEISELDQYAHVYENSKNGGARELGFFSYIAFLIRVIIFPLVSIYIIKRKLNKNILNKYMHKFEYIVCWFIYMSILCLFIKILNRFNNYFIPFIIVLVADAFYSTFKVNHKKIKLTLATWYIILIPYSYIFINYYFKELAPGVLYLNKYYPYETFFYKVEDSRKDFIFK